MIQKLKMVPDLNEGVSLAKSRLRYRLRYDPELQPGPEVTVVQVNLGSLSGQKLPGLSVRNLPSIVPNSS